MRGAICIALLAAVTIACTPNQRIVNSSVGTPAPAPFNVQPGVSNFESDLQTMRNADFKFILVFRRKDGAVLSPEDKSFANANGTFAANRRRLGDEGRAIMIGSNFQFQPGVLEQMAERFTMENYSKPDSGPMVSNSAANK